jgi:DNA-binding transcriptional regulator GbsR (MarR family)
MGKQTNAYKQRWEAEHYKQVKVSVRRELAAAFKASCEAAGVSAAGEISAFMAERCGQTREIGTRVAARCKRSTLYESDADALSSKRKRRAALKKILSRLETIKDAHNAALDNTPENLRGSEAYENAEESLSLIEEAIDTVEALAEIY